MEIALGIVLILSFFALVYYCIKGHNLMVGFFIMTCIWALIALVGNCIVPNEAISNKYGELGGDVTLWTQSLGVLKNIFQEGPQGYGSSILVNIFFGAFFGRILVETNIASTLIRKVVELGGDKPRIILGLLCIVTSLLFTSMTGIGPVISIAVIIVPILLTLGVSAPVTLFAFMGSIMAGIFANMTNFAQYIGIFGGADLLSYREYAWLGWTGLVVTLVVVLVISNLVMSFSKTSHAWAAKSPNQLPKVKMKKGQPVIMEPVENMSKIENAPWYSWLSIILPVLLVITLDFPIILAFIVSGLYALITCRKLNGGFKGICRKLAKLFGDGAIDVAPMIGFLLCLAMFNNSANFVAPYFKAILGDIIPTAGLALAIVFAIFAPLGFFRGPLNLVGCGAAILAVLKSTCPNFFDPVTIGGIADSQLLLSTVTFGFGLFAITTVAPQHLDVTQSWVAWGFGYTKVSTKDYMKMSIPTGWIVCVIMIFVLYFVSLANGVF